LFTNGLLVSRDIVRRNVVLGWVVLVSSNAAPIKAVKSFPAGGGATRMSLRSNVAAQATSSSELVSPHHCKARASPAKLATESLL